MSCINSDTVDFWRQLANDLSAQRPSYGKRVRVTVGRKHIGKEGTVERHQVSRYGSAFRYGGEANLHMREMAGRDGFVCLVRDDGGVAFWVPAENVEVLA